MNEYWVVANGSVNLCDFRPDEVTAVKVMTANGEQEERLQKLHLLLERARASDNNYHDVRDLIESIIR